MIFKKVLFNDFDSMLLSSLHNMASSRPRVGHSQSQLGHEIRDGTMIRHFLTYFRKQSIVILRLDSNTDSVALNNTYSNMVNIFNKLFKKMNNIKIKNLIVTPTQ